MQVMESYPPEQRLSKVRVCVSEIIKYYDEMNTVKER